MPTSNDTSIADRALPTPPSVASKKLGRQKRLEDRMSINYDALCDIHIGDINLTGEMIGRDVATKHPVSVAPAVAPACAGIEFGNMEEEDPSTPPDRRAEEEDEYIVKLNVRPVVNFDDDDCAYMLGHVA